MKNSIAEDIYMSAIGGYWELPKGLEVNRSSDEYVKLSEAVEKLGNMLPEESQDEWDSVQIDLSRETELAGFISGFKWGARLMMEVLSDE